MCCCQCMTDGTLKVPEPPRRGFIIIGGKQQQRCPAVNALALQRERSKKLSREAPGASPTHSCWGCSQCRSP